MVQQLLIAFYYYGYQLSKARRKFGVQVSTFNLCFCHGQLVSFPVATYRPLTSFAAKRGKLQARNIVTIGNEEYCNFKYESSSPKLCRALLKWEILLTK